MSREFSHGNPFTAPRVDVRAPDVGAVGERVLGSATKRVLRQMRSGKRVVGNAQRGEFVLSANEVKARQDLRDAENERRLKIAVEYLGKENVHGVEDVEFALGFQVDHSLIPEMPFTEEDFKKSKELRERGIKEMLILCVSADHEGRPLTGSRLKDIFTQRYQDRGFEPFLKKEQEAEEVVFGNNVLPFEWKLVTKECIPSSNGKTHSYLPRDFWEFSASLDYVIQNYGEMFNIPFESLHRPSPLEMFYAIAVHRLTTHRDEPGKGEKILERRYHWTDVTALDSFLGRAIAVGYTHHQACISFVSRGTIDDNYGVCLSRDPSSLV